MKKNPFTRFTHRHPVLFNSILAIIVFCAGIYAMFLFIDIFTDHGTEVKVPEIRYKPLNEAISILDDAGLDYEVDSVYNEDSTPGIVLDQNPEPGSMVKATRIVTITVNMMQPPKIELPADLTDMGGADGITDLQSLGFKYVSTDTIPSPASGLIISIKVNGRNTVPGTKVPINAKIVLSIGDGKMDTEVYDPLGDALRDSLIDEYIKEGQFKITTDSAGRTISVLK